MRAAGARAAATLACVLGDADLLRALSLAGIPCAVVAATNGSIWRVLRPIRRIIPFSPRRRDGGTHVWERVVDGFDYKYSIVKTDDHSFTATL